jgi:hypothetical protein
MAKETISVRVEEETVEFLKRQGESPHVQARIDLEAFQQILESEERALRGIFTVQEALLLVISLNRIADKNPSARAIPERIYFLLEKYFIDTHEYESAEEQARLKCEGAEEQALLRKVRCLSLLQALVVFRLVKVWWKEEAGRKKKNEEPLEDKLVRVFGAVRVVSNDQVLDQ